MLSAKTRANKYEVKYEEARKENIDLKLQVDELKKSTATTSRESSDTSPSKQAKGPEKWKTKGNEKHNVVTGEKILFFKMKESSDSRTPIIPKSELMEHKEFRLREPGMGI